MFVINFITQTKVQKEELNVLRNCAFIDPILKQSQPTGRTRTHITLIGYFGLKVLLMGVLYLY